MRYVAVLLGVVVAETAEARYLQYESRSVYSRSYYGSTHSTRSTLTDERPPKNSAPDRPNLCDLRGAVGFEVVTGPTRDRGCFGSAR